VGKRGSRLSVSGVVPDREPFAPIQTVAALLTELTPRLRGFDNPVRGARDIVAALLDVPRHWPMVNEEAEIDRETWARAVAAADKIAAGAPLAYAVGKANFRQLTLAVDERVLIPRPETELLVDLVLERVKPGGIAVDVGTGSGAIALALATEGKFSRVIGVDLSTDALEVARANAESLGAANVDLLAGDLLQPTAGSIRRKARVIVCNPPYIAFEEIAQLPPSVRDWEPMIALLSGDNGLETTARLVPQAAEQLEPGGLLALEVDARRAGLVAEKVSSDARFRDVSVHLDLAGRERFVLAVRRRNGE
jgi:release factor glutamine methyltransferase